MERKQAKTLRSAIFISVIIAISKVVGLLREMNFAAYFADSVQATAYFSAFKLFSALTMLFTVGISSTFIPIYTKSRLNHGELDANRYANHILNLYILVGVVASIAAYCFAPALSRLIWWGEDKDVIAPLISQLSRLMYPMLAFWAMSGVLCNVLTAREKFVPEQLMGFALSFCSIIACTIYGTVQSVAFATGIAGVFQVVILLPFLKGQFKYEMKLGLNDPQVHRTFLVALPALVSMTFDDINSMVNSMVGSSISSSVGATLGYCYRVLMLVLGILVVPLTTVMYPKLSMSAARNDKKGVILTLRQCTEILAIITLPIIAISLVSSDDIIGILFQRGRFTEQSTQAAALPMALYMVGVFGFALRNFQTRVFYALQDTKPPMIIGIIAVAINVALNLLLAPKLGAAGLTLATSISGSGAALMMLFTLRAKLGKMEIKRTIDQLIRITASAAVCFAAMYYLRGFAQTSLGVSGVNFTARLIRLAGCSILSLLAYVLLLVMFKVEEVKSLVSILSEKAGSKRG